MKKADIELKENTPLYERSIKMMTLHKKTQEEQAQKRLDDEQKSYNFHPTISEMPSTMKLEQTMD